MPLTSSTARKRLNRSATTRKLEPPELPVGRIVGRFGTRGELKCDPTSAGRALFVGGAEFRYATPVSEGRARLESVREHQGRLLLRIEGVSDPESASAFVGATLFAPKNSVQLEPGEFLDVDLSDCDVTGADGCRYGTVERVEHYPAGDMLVVAGRLVPMVSAIVRSIDIEGRRIVVDPPAGLLDDDAL